MKCPGTQFKCLDGSIHPWKRACDGVKDCKDGEDERNCAGNHD